MPPGSTLVVGFLGGFERWNDEHRGVRRLVLRLRERPAVYAESASHRRRRTALKFIRRALDTNHNGRLDQDERDAARVVLFGQSWGGGAAILAARSLNKLGVPVLLTVQVDSVGLRDNLIPPNVSAAVNFFQHDPLTVHGERNIRPVDPSRTRILGNFQATYLFRRVNGDGASWLRHKLGGSHAKMELDPATWDLVDRYIDDAISKR
jgi:hypothetical protein